MSDYPKHIYRAKDGKLETLQVHSPEHETAAGDDGFTEDLAAVKEDLPKPDGVKSLHAITAENAAIANLVKRVDELEILVKAQNNPPAPASPMVDYVPEPAAEEEPTPADEMPVDREGNPSPDGLTESERATSPHEQVE